MFIAALRALKKAITPLDNKIIATLAKDDDLQDENSITLRAELEGFVLAVWTTTNRGVK